MKGIILAGGSGSRLYPITLAVSKQLLPVYDKPMIYYPLSVLMLSGIREILLISTPQDLPLYKRLLGDGSAFGVRLVYAEQSAPRGLAESFLIGREFIGQDSVALILGDNIFFTSGLSGLLREAKERLEREQRPTIFGLHVSDPERYGVAVLEGDKLVGVVEKPQDPPTRYAIVGLYYYPNSVVEVAAGVEPSQRGELEITSINQHYIEEGVMHFERLPRGMTWLDTGTHDSLHEASALVMAHQKRQGYMIASIHEIAYRAGWIDEAKLREVMLSMRSTPYGLYLQSLIEH